MAKRRKRRGVGQTITIRRMRGLGSLKRPSSFMGAALPPVLGGGATAATILATRYFANPLEGETPAMLYKWAPLLGWLTGGIGSFALYYLGGGPAAISSFASSTLVAAGQMAHDFLVTSDMSRAGAHIAAFQAPAAAGNGTAGMGVVVPQRLMGAGGVNGIVMEPTASRDPLRRYGLGASGYGEEVSLGAVNPSAFGTPGFGY